MPLRNRQFVFNHTSVDHTKYDSVRRAVYLPVIRNNLYTLFAQFDFPDPTMPTGRRSETVVAPQALLMLNYDLVVESASRMAEALLALKADDAERVAAAYLMSVGRPATAKESARAVAFIEDTGAAAVTATGLDKTDQMRSWAMLCQSLLASNEFFYVR